jgi:hypothetical protein
MFSLGWAGSTTGPGNGETPGMAGDCRTVVAGLAGEAGEGLPELGTVVEVGTVVDVDVGVVVEPWAELTAAEPKNSTAVTPATRMAPSFLLLNCSVIKVSLSELGAKAV